MSLKKEFIRIIKFLQEKNIDFVITGMIAASVWGVIRATKDIDIVVTLSDENINAIYSFAKIYGYSFPSETSYQLTLRNEETLVDIDFIFCNYTHCKSLMKRAVYKKILNYKVKIAKPEDIIIGKLIRLVTEPYYYQDKVDIVMLATYNKLDIEYLKKWIEKYNLYMRLKEVIEDVPEKYGNENLSPGIKQLSLLLSSI